MTARQIGSVLWPRLRILQIYGANTGVGKTIFSSLLCRTLQRHIPRLHYLKPVSTGPLDEADDRHISRLGADTRTKCLYQFDEPVSPHIAVRSAAKPLPDHELQAAVYDELESYARADRDAIAIVETAGGVLSPAPSGSSQADVYRPFRLSTLLIGDHQLGGIGTTISAWESLHLRGYDVQSVGLFAEDRYDNHTYLTQYFSDRGVDVFSVKPPPSRLEDVKKDMEAMQQYYEEGSKSSGLEAIASKFLKSHERRIEELKALPAAAHDRVWHPFLQHTERNKDNITVIDSAYGDHFATYTTTADASTLNTSLLKSAFDGSASWWTQGLGHGNPRLALTAAHAAGRYGHVMFASAVHAPALQLANRLVERSNNTRLTKVFFSDNGSTGMEVAVKMALRAASVRNGWNAESDDVSILGLKGSYHGDTIGTMDCSEPSVYNKKVEWYRGRGHWLDFPQIKMRKGQWIIDMPAEANGALGDTRTIECLDQAFDSNAREHDYARYKKYCDGVLTDLQNSGKKIGALVMEPIILGAGGMFLADPMFQRALIDAAREGGTPPPKDLSTKSWRGMPVVFDEVFTGLYRLGKFSAASFLHAEPDIVVNAKLLTGGLLPLCTTTASQDIFEAFLSNDRSDALLHGHSYTAHPIGCMVANESLDTMEQIEQSESWSGFKNDWKSSPSAEPLTWSMWSREFVQKLSFHENVDYTFALGSVLAISLKDPAGSGYTSLAAVGLRDKLFAGRPEDGWVVHSRVLGNVLYLMAAISTTPASLASLERQVLKDL